MGLHSQNGRPATAAEAPLRRTVRPLCHAGQVVDRRRPGPDVPGPGRDPGRGYPRVILWVLEQNAGPGSSRALGFPAGRPMHWLDWLGGVTEVADARDLDGP